MSYRIIDNNNKVVGEILIYSQENPEPEPVPEPTPEPTPEPSSTKVALVIGHDVNSKGAYGNEGMSEFDFNDKLLNELTDKYPSSNRKLFYRDEDISGYGNQMTDLHQRMDKWGADISIEFHFNATSNQDVHGHEVLYCSEAGKKVAELLNTSYDKYLPTSNRGAKKITMDDNGGGFCCRGKSIAIIAEPFFGAHQDRFIEGGSLRHDLIYATLEFVSQL